MISSQPDNLQCVLIWEPLSKEDTKEMFNLRDPTSKSGYKGKEKKINFWLMTFNNISQIRVQWPKPTTTEDEEWAWLSINQKYLNYEIISKLAFDLELLEVDV
jgi:hypothetical protein